MVSTLPIDTPLLEWEAPEGEHFAHGKSWYICAALFLFFCIGYAIWTGAWSFVVVLVLIAGVYVYAHRTPPKDLHIRIWKTGYAVKDEFIKWDECKGYWMLQSPLSTTLTIAHTKALTPFTKIQLGTTDPHAVHEVLDQFLPHTQDKKENLIDIIIHICKL